MARALIRPRRRTLARSVTPSHPPRWRSLMSPATPAFSGLNATHVRAERDAYTTTTAALADEPGLRPLTPSSHRAKPQASARAPTGAGRARRAASSSLDATHIPAELKAFERGARAIGDRHGEPGHTRPTHAPTPHTLVRSVTPSHPPRWRSLMGPATPAFSALNATHVRAERDAFTTIAAALTDGPTHRPLTPQRYTHSRRPQRP